MSRLKVGGPLERLPHSVLSWHVQEPDMAEAEKEFWFIVAVLCAWVALSILGGIIWTIRDERRTRRIFGKFKRK